MNDILNTKDINNLLTSLDNPSETSIDYSSHRLSFAFYDKLTFEQRVKVIKKIKDNEKHFSAKFFKNLEKNQAQLSKTEVSILPFSKIKEEYFTNSLTKKFTLNNEEIYISLPLFSINLLLDRKINTPLDNISTYMVNKYFFDLYQKELAIEYSGEIESEEEKKEVLSAKLGEEDEEESYSEIKSKYGKNNLFLSITFSYDYKNIHGAFNVALSYQACLKLINEEKYIGELHNQSFYKKDDGYAILCSGKLNESQIKDIKVGSILKFKTYIEESIYLYVNQKYQGRAICVDHIESDFYHITPLNDDEEKEIKDANTVLLLGCGPQQNFIPDSRNLIQLDTRVSSALPLVFNNKIIALGYPLCIDNKYAYKVVKLISPGIEIK